MDNKINLQLINEIFQRESSKQELKGIIGVAPFDSVYRSLMPIQQNNLKELCTKNFENLMEQGSIICLAYAYPEYAIDAIGVKKGNNYDLEAWAIYGQEYSRLNKALDETTMRIAKEINGLRIPATFSGDNIEHVEEYYAPAVFSHRVAAELAGIGWRGKNELIINPRYSCAIRLSSVITSLPLERTLPLEMDCGNCQACSNACSFLRLKDKLTNYREQCMHYMDSLGVLSGVCGKCIKACYRDSIYKDKFKL